MSMNIQLGTALQIYFFIWGFLSFIASGNWEELLVFTGYIVMVEVAKRIMDGSDDN